MFRVGQKVVCVNDRPGMVDICPCHPRKGEIYTIRGIVTQPHIPGYGVYLEELINPSHIWADFGEMEWPFASERFRPLVDDDTKVVDDALLV